MFCRLEPGIIPQPAIVCTIGKLAATNPHEILSFIKITLTIVLPMLSQMRDETLKQSICFSMYMCFTILIKLVVFFFI